MWQFLQNSQRFKQELATWQAEGLITSEQVAKFEEKYSLNAPSPWYRNTSFILQTVAVLLAVMGFFLLIGMNWELLPIPVRTLIGLVPLLISYFVAWKKYSEGNESAAEVTMILASLLFGANIALQAQIYHISSYAPDGVLWWILGTIPAIYFFRSNALAIIFQFLFMIWLGLQLENDQFAFWGIIIAGSLILFLHKNPNSIHLVFAIISSFLFINNVVHFLTLGSYESFTFWVLFANIYVLICLTSIEFIKHEYSETFITRLQNILATFILIMLYALTFDNAISSLLNRDLNTQTVIFLVFCYVLATGLWFWKNTFKLDSKQHNLSINFVFVALFMSMLLFKSNESTILIYTILFNLLLLAFIVYKIYSGIQEHNKSRFMWGIAYLLILAFSRYISLFGEDYLLTGVLFIACSLGILLVNRFWNKKFADK
jgi:uncharacterized membrane protein